MTGSRATPGFVLVVGSLLYTLAYFMAMPLLSLGLEAEHHLSTARIGAIVATIPLVSSLLGGPLGSVADRVGRRRMCLLGSGGFAAGYGSLTLARTPLHFVLGCVVLGLSKAAWDPAFRALLAEVTPPQHRAAVYRWRYGAMCGGAVVGPAIGVALFGHGMAILFAGPALLLALHTVWLAWAFANLVPATTKAGDEAESAPEERRSRGFAYLIADPRLGALVGAGFLFFCVFSLFDTILPLALHAVLDRAEARFAGLMILSAVAAIGLQVPLTRLPASTDVAHVAVFGCGAMALSFAFFAVAGRSFTPYLLGTLLFAVGEATVYPNVDVLIERIAPAHLRSTYFGVADVRYLGFVAGPASGGWILGAYGTPLLFSICAAITCASGVALVFHHRLVRKHATGQLEQVA